MEVIRYCFTLIIGFLVGCFPLLMSVIICRVGISLCNEMKKDEECDTHTRNILDFQLKKYYFSLLIQLFIICLVTFLFYLFLKEEFMFYLIVVAITFICNYKNTGKTMDNMQGFYRNLKINRQIYDNK